jgi:hypothetical protein
MMLLTATNTAAARWQRLATDRAGQRHCRRSSRARLIPIRSESVFYSPVANLLEIPGVAFHYSVIGGCATIALARGLAGRHTSNDEVTASGMRGGAAGAQARAGGE